MWKRYAVGFIAITLLLCGPDFVSDSFGQDSVPFEPQKFIREAGKPEKIVKPFAAENIAGKHTLIVQNGDEKGSKVTSAVIYLNGQRVVRPGEFNKNVDWITKTVTLEEQNEIAVEIRGKPDTWIVVTIIEKNWFYEHEFDQDDSLRAQPHHIVILDLQPGDGLEPITHSIPYEYTEEGDYTFCIDPDDAYITAMSLVNESGDEVLSINRDDGCAHGHLAAGMYTKHVTHDETAVSDAGTVAFISQPGSEYASSPQSLSNNMEQTASLFPEWPAYGALQVSGGDHDGKYLTAHPEWNSNYPRSIIPKVIPLDSTTTSAFNNFEHLFSFETYSEAINEDPSFIGTYYFHSYQSDDNQTYFTYNPFSCNDNSQLCIDSQNLFNGNVIMSIFWDILPKETVQVEDKGDNEFSLWMEAYPLSPLTGIYAAQENSFLYLTHFAEVPTNPTVFKTLTMRFYEDGTKVGSLQEGEVAYFEGENYTGRAFVVSGSFEDSAPVALDTIQSIKFGFNTTIQFFGQTNYDSLIRTMGADSGSIKPPLNGADIESLKLFNSKNILLSSSKCRYCNLANVDLNSLSLAGVDLSYAILYGANMNYCNLKGANLFQASLNGDLQSNNTAATLSGAYLKNVNLAYANLNGADFTAANFYHTTAKSCQPGDWSFANPCASAYGATMNSTKFINAYLNGVDMSNSDARGCIFTNAMLLGVHFNGANLDRDPITNASTSFIGAFIGGANFSNAKVYAASFSSVYVIDLQEGKCLFFKLDAAHIGFADYWGGPPRKSICVMFQYTDGFTKPATDLSNKCPGGGPGECSDEEWLSPEPPMDDAGQPAMFCNFTNDDPSDICEFHDVDLSW
ncbi:MAG: pentapeptide repeat-containing protein [Proteobacteria bacterium]|nr:pentapeptide repeat-containing protein [Pseudomonadota bacterium]